MQLVAADVCSPGDSLEFQKTSDWRKLAEPNANPAYGEEFQMRIELEFTGANRHIGWCRACSQ